LVVGALLNNFTEQNNLFNIDNFDIPLLYTSLKMLSNFYGIADKHSSNAFDVKHFPLSPPTSLKVLRA